MSITIRLSRIGRKNQPAYKLVVSNTKDKRMGRFVDILGHFNPTDKENTFSYDKEKFEKWEKRGALVTEAVRKLIDKKYEYIKYEPKKVTKKEGEDKPQSQDKAEEKTEEKTEEKKQDVVEDKEVTEEKEVEEAPKEEPKEEPKIEEEKAVEENTETEEEKKDE